MRLSDHYSHQHPLILVDTQYSHTTITVEDLCNGCVRPIKNLPYYKCTSSGCNFLLHAFCTRLPTELKFGHPYYPRHTLILVSKVARNSVGLFLCGSCDSPCNGFAYSCVDCDYIVDVRCAFMSSVITHKSHPNHTLTRFRTGNMGYCGICLLGFTYGDKTAYRCQYCDFHLHTECAVLLPETIKHKYDKHSMTLTYGPVEDHGGDYFCEVCEEELNPYISFYHCHKCAQSIHVACAPEIISPPQCKPFFGGGYTGDITYDYVNIKGGIIYKIEDHSHPLSIFKGTGDDGRCSKQYCNRRLKGNLILKCLECKFAIDINCLK
ncbi:hypothetical protein SSX86_021145 [Deinandra increscens subsp. villosa]|uniref:Phorbol-ester/DAG-type domain-containing protein n=1 Tax=Deinandra increscens subsp. villosa TaxID=3103831 RepID=A0AAP0CQQ9_9ASTR